MSYKTCSHVMENGLFCQSPALRKKEYCYFHIEFRARRLKMARTRARGERWWLDLPCIEDLPSCQAAAARVFEASAAHLIDPADAKVLFSGLRLMASNFKARKAWTSQQSDYHNDRSQDFVGAYPDFEAVHDLPEDIDLDANPLQLFPMPEESHDQHSPGAPFKPPFGLSGSEKVEERNANSELSSGAPLNRAVGLSGTENAQEPFVDADTTLSPFTEATAESLELMEIGSREGEAAMLKRARQLERNRSQRERRQQRARLEEMARLHNIQIAAQKLLREQQRAQAVKAQAAGPQPSQAPQAAQPEPPMKKPPISSAAAQQTEAANASSMK